MSKTNMLSRPIGKGTQLGLVRVLLVSITGTVLPPIARAQKVSVDIQGQTKQYDKSSTVKKAEPPTLTVDANGEAKYRCIQAAIDAAPAGSVIRVGPGKYEEHLTINKPVTLEGAGCNQTTIITRNHAADTFEEAMHLFLARMITATSDEQRMVMKKEFEAEIKEGLGVPTLLVTDTDRVVIRDLKFTSPGRHLDGRLLSTPIVKVSNAKVAVLRCAVIGSPGDGIHVLGRSDVEIRNCLVAAVWSRGIVVARKNNLNPRASILDSDLRNCYYAGICIGAGCNSTVVKRCRISGAAWHGIRYNNASSPVIDGNLIFGNARCGIYASGATSAVVKQNVFFKNEQSGISCWANNKDTIEKNTFVSNLREGLTLHAEARPTIRQNIFVGHPKAVIARARRDTASSIKEGLLLELEGNLYWKNDTATVRFIRKPDSEVKVPEQKLETVPIHETGSVAIDPMFTNAPEKNFSLVTHSPARRAGIGVADPITFRSPWPLQPEETAIIPEGETRNCREWKQQPHTKQQGIIDQPRSPRKSVTRPERRVEEYNALVAELDADLAAYRASIPLFSKFSDVYINEICPLVVRGVQAGIWLGDARKRGMRLSNYDKQKAGKAYMNILATIYKDIYPEFRKAIKGGQFALSSPQGRSYFQTCYAHFQISDNSLSRPFEAHYPYQDKNTIEYWYFAKKLMEAALVAAAPLRKMVEQIPPELKEKQRRIYELYAEFVRQAQQDGETAALPAAYKEPYLKKLEDAEARWSLPEKLHREAEE